MPIRKFKPTSPGSRFRVGNKFTELTPDTTPEKSLLAPIKQTGGRNHKGKMTQRHRGGGHKRRYRMIDFKRDKDGMTARIKSIEYDPNRTAFIALLVYTDGEKRYIIAPRGLQAGDNVVSGAGSPVTVGNALLLSEIPLGSAVHAIEMTPGKGAALARAAGTSGTVTSREGRFVVIKLPSGEIRRVLQTCKATIGTTSNPDHSLQVLGKAGRKRWLGRRPHTRGVAMNPVDHPMGGGEGRASGGHPQSRSGIMAKGEKTRNVKKHSSKLIITRRKKRNKK